MTEELFIKELADILEVEPETVTMESDFRESADFWSSLTGFAILVFLEERCGVTLDVETFLKLNTVGDLYAIVTASKEKP